MTLKVSIDNTYTTINSPIVISVGEYVTKPDGYKCITKLAPTQYNIDLITETNITKLDSNSVQCAAMGSYSIAVYKEVVPLKFGFYIYQQPQMLTPEILLSIINDELPSIYKPTNELNNADNYGIASVMSKLYEQVYILFYNAITSVGSGNEYNTDWEFVYLGINNLLQNAIYPARLINTLMQVNTKTSVQIQPMAILISRLSFQFNGTFTPVQIAYNVLTDIYEINIFSSAQLGWQIGINGRTEMGYTTILQRGSSISFLYVLSIIIGRLMPIQVKYKINTFTMADFNANFKVSQVSILDYIDETVNYDAYGVVNNNNDFNTKGYFLK